MKKIGVIGSFGNMGRRYVKILQQYTKCDVIEIDCDHNIDMMGRCDGFIVATPTDNHYSMLHLLSHYRKPVLCEKPLIKNREKLLNILNIDGFDLSMINQYAFIAGIPPNLSYGPTKYNYFKSGGDGLAWDCINILGGAFSDVELSNESVIWECMINGQRLSIKDMDRAYIDNIVAWVNGWRNKDYILIAHDAVWRYLDDQKSK